MSQTNITTCPECGEDGVRVNVSMTYDIAPIDGEHYKAYVIEKDELDNLANWTYDASCDHCGWTHTDVEVELA